MSNAVRKQVIHGLSGAQLTWAVAVAEGLAVSHIEDGDVWLYLTEYRTASVKECPDFAKDWAAAGPIIERERILLSPHPVGGLWTAKKFQTMAFGETVIEAAMRAFAAYRLGGEVEIPEVKS